MLKHLKIGKKLLISFIAISLLASVAGITSMFILRYVDSQYSSALTQYGFSQGDIGKAMLTFSNNNASIRDVTSLTDAALIQEAKDEVTENDEKYKNYEAAVEKTLDTDEEKAQFQKIQTAKDAYMAKREEILAIGDTTDEEQSRQAQLMTVQELDPLFNTFYNEWAGLMDMYVNTGNDLSSKLTTQGSFFLILNIVLVVVALLLSVFFGLLISRGISKPINKCVERLVLLEKGDLTTPVPASDSRDETGILLNALKGTVEGLQAIIGEVAAMLSQIAGGDFNIHTQIEEKYVGEFQTLRDSLRKLSKDMSNTLGQIDESSNQVAAGSDQVSSGAQALSQGATEQASSVEELAATINEISNQIQDTAENAEAARIQIDNTGTEVGICSQQMKELIAAMDEISVNSSEIGKIIKTIEDIAFQTNILALNAAVEAARAGTAGKGFAVVADEVRNLASKSAEASKNTATLIENAVNSVGKGTKIAEDTSDSLNKVVTSSNAVMEIAGNISVATQRQADSITQVTTGIDQISSVVQTNSATAEESAAASEELSGQAQMLKNLISRFNLRQEA